MGGRGHGGGGKVMVHPINVIFKLLQARTLISVWLFENLNMRIEGRLRGFDEFMNLVLEEATEVYLPRKDQPESRRKIGTILLKGDNVTLIQEVQQ